MDNREILDNIILEEQQSFFETANITAKATSEGLIKSFVLAGSAGIGKSYGIEQILKDRDNVKFVGGHVSNGGLYRLLFNNRFKDSCIVFDDSDSILQSEISLGLLKHSLESKPVRNISWISQAILKNDDGEPLPPSFDFEASIVFLSNLNIIAMVDKGTKLSPHLEAIVSRSVFLNAFKIFDSPRAYLVRINSLKQHIFKAEGMNSIEQSIISQFINTNYLDLCDISLRLVIKLCVYELTDY